MHVCKFLIDNIFSCFLFSFSFKNLKFFKNGISLAILIYQSRANQLEEQMRVNAWKKALIGISFLLFNLNLVKKCMSFVASQWEKKEEIRVRYECVGCDDFICNWLLEGMSYFDSIWVKTLYLFFIKLVLFMNFAKVLIFPKNSRPQKINKFTCGSRFNSSWWSLMPHISGYFAESYYLVSIRISLDR